MRKILSLILSMVVLLTAVTCVAAPVSANTETSKSYDFSDAAELSDFFTAGPDTGAWGTWTTADGKLQVTGNPNANWYGTSFLTKNTYGDFTMEFDADVSAGYGIILRAGDDARVGGAGLNAWYAGNAYTIMHWAPVEQDASVAIYDYNGSSSSEAPILAGCGFIDPMTNAHWCIQASGNVISFTLTDNNDEDNIMTYTYTDSESRYTAGHIGFYNLTAAGFTSFKVDNLVITGKPVGFVDPTVPEEEPDVPDYDFSNAAQLSDFFVAGPDTGAWGNWTVADGKLQVTGNPIADWWGTSLITKNTYDDFTMEFDADVSAGYGIILRASDDGKTPNAGLNSWFGGNGYCIMHWAPVEKDASVAIYNYDGSNEMLVGCGPIAPMTQAHWKITAQGNVISFTVTDKNDADNTMTYSFTDTNNRYFDGHIGFYNLTAAGVTSFKADNLSIKGDPTNGLKILAIGNSHTQDATQWLYELADAAGYENVTVGNLFIGGCTLDRHWENADTDAAAYAFETKKRAGKWEIAANTTMKSGIKAKKWDYIILYQNGAGSGFSSTFTHLEDLADYVKANATNPDMKLGWNLGFPYRADYYTANPDCGYANQNDQFAKITSVVQNTVLPTEKFDFVIPTGTAVCNVMTSYTGNALYRDQLHLGYLTGRYIAGLAWLRAITGADITDLTWVPSGSAISANTLGMIKEAVNNAIAVPYEVTASTYTADTKAAGEYHFYDPMELNDFFAAGPDNAMWGNWTVGDGMLNVTGNAGAQWWGTSFLTKAEYSDFVMDFDATVSAGYGVILRASDDAVNAGSGLNTWFGGNGYCLMHWEPVETTNSFQIIDYCGSNNVLASCGAMGRVMNARDGMNSVHWHIVAQGDTVTFTVTDNDDSDNVFTYTYTDPENRYTSGHIGFYNLTFDGATTLQVDNLVINGIADVMPDAPIWQDTFSGATGECYTPYGYWWNNFTSFATSTDYTGVLGNEGVEFPGWCYYYLNDYEFSDCSVEFDLKAGQNQWGIMLRTGNPSGSDDAENGYAVIYDGNGLFVSREDGGFNMLQSGAPFWWSPTDNGYTIKHIRAEIVGNTISIYLNRSNRAVISVTDDTFKAGKIGFRVLTDANKPANFVIDNLTVYGKRMGDINGDGAVDVLDLIRLKKYFADNTVSIESSCAEISNNGVIDADDMVRMRKYLIGKVSTVYAY